MRLSGTEFALSIVLAAVSASAAAEPWDLGDALDTCILAVVGERPGVVTGWRQEGGGAQPPYAISILNTDGKIAETTCDPASPSNFKFEDKIGVYRYTMYKRATIPEVQARVSAPKIFKGPVRMLAMELSVSLMGTPSYEYQMFLPDGYKAWVWIDATTGRMTSAEVK